MRIYRDLRENCDPVAGHAHCVKVAVCWLMWCETKENSMQVVVLKGLQTKATPEANTGLNFAMMLQMIRSPKPTGTMTGTFGC